MTTLNGLRVTSAIVTLPVSGVWYADLQLDLDDGQTIPMGPASLVVGTRTCVCSVDDRFSGTFGARTAVRVLGGAGGWHKPVAAQDYANDGGVMLSAVALTTASLVGESASVSADFALGAKYVRTAERASRVLDGVSWWVGLDGATVVGPRTETTPTANVDVIEYDPLVRTLTLASDELLEPGNKITNDLFGSLILQDVEHTISADGFRVVASVRATGGGRLLSALQRIAGEASGATWQRSYRYRVVVGQGDTLALQAVRVSPGLPDMVPLSTWHGLPGCSAVMQPGSEVLIEFIEGDPAQPVVVAFEPSEGSGFLPLMLRLNATTAVQVGDETALPVAHAAETMASVNALLASLQAMAGALGLLGAAPLTGASLSGVMTTALTPAQAALSSAAATLPTRKLVAE